MGRGEGDLLARVRGTAAEEHDEDGRRRIVIMIITTNNNNIPSRPRA